MGYPLILKIPKDSFLFLKLKNKPFSTLPKTKVQELLKDKIINDRII